MKRYDWRRFGGGRDIEEVEFGPLKEGDMSEDTEMRTGFFREARWRLCTLDVIVAENL